MPSESGWLRLAAASASKKSPGVAGAGWFPAEPSAKGRGKAPPRVPFEATSGAALTGSITITSLTTGAGTAAGTGSGETGADAGCVSIGKVGGTVTVAMDACMGGGVGTPGPRRIIPMAKAASWRRAIPPITAIVTRKLRPGTGQSEKPGSIIRLPTISLHLVRLDSQRTYYATNPESRHPLFAPRGAAHPGQSL